jgi:predicted RNA-binding protein with PUA-like domain
MQYWLMKSEPNCFSLDDLKSRKNQTEPWDGVRNYQARNMMRDQMKIGDKVFFYHSNCKVPGIVGMAKVVTTGYPDPTQFDPDEGHFDPKSDPNNPRWFLVDVQFVKQFKETISLEYLKTLPELSGMQLLRKGNRLSVMPVEKTHWEIIISSAK